MSDLSYVRNNDGSYSKLVQLSGSIVENDRVKVQLDGTAFFVDGAAGLDTNAGTAASPLKTIQAAVNKPNAAVVIVKPGIYRESITLNKPITILNSHSGPFGNMETDSLTHMVDIRGSERFAGTWTLFDAVNSVYTTTFSTYNPRDILVEDIITANKLFTVLTKRNSVADVQANPGSWYRDGSNVLHVRMPDNSNPSIHQIEILSDLYPLKILSGCSYASFRGIAFSLSGNAGVDISQDGTKAMNEYNFYECVFRYHRNVWNARGMGLGTSGNMITKAYGCRAYGNKYDGFNYHYGGHHELHGCHSYHNDDDGVSPHEGAYLLVRGGHFYNNVKAGLIAVTGSMMDVEHVRTSGNGQGISYYDRGTKGRVFRSITANNAVGLRVTTNAQVTVDTLASTGNTTPEDITSGGEKWTVA